MKIFLKKPVLENFARLTKNTSDGTFIKKPCNFTKKGLYVLFPKNLLKFFRTVFGLAPAIHCFRRCVSVKLNILCSIDPMFHTVYFVTRMCWYIHSNCYFLFYKAHCCISEFSVAKKGLNPKYFLTCKPLSSSVLKMFSAT